MKKIYCSEIFLDVDLDFYRQFASDLFPKLEDQKTNPILSALISTFQNDRNQFPLYFGKNKDIEITKEKWRLFQNEYFNLCDTYKSDTGQYRRCKIDTNKIEYITQQLPQSVSSLIYEVSLQITFFNGLWPHTDHNRSSSLICNLTDSQNWFTSWYDVENNVLQTESKDLGFFWPWAPSNTKKSFIKVLNQYQWYTFDNISYHGTECMNYHEPRRSLVIEFKELTATELYLLLSTNIK